MLNNVTEYKHKSGLNVIYIKKPGFNERYAMFTTKYGAIDSFLKNTSTNETLEVPQGIAHFLEHKLFEQEDINVMQEYARLGASPNAFTSSVQTSYLFSCANNFEKSLRLLLKYVQSPFFTEQNVEKERGIIEQEINMYLDNPDAVVYMNFLKALYVAHPVRNDVAGTVESISNITPDLLNFLYNTYYIPENMVLTVSGDESEDVIKSIVDEEITKEWYSRERTGYVTDFPAEPKEVCQRKISAKMDVAMPNFIFGYKDVNDEENALERVKKELELKFVMEVLFGESSKFYATLYNEGLINDTFFNFYKSERSFSFAAFGGETKYPEKVVDKIKECIFDAKSGGIDEEAFARIKNSNYGAFVKRLNSVERVGRLYTSAYFAGISVIDYFSLYDRINFNSAVKHLGLFDENRSAISIVE